MPTRRSRRGLHARSHAALRARARGLHSRPAARPPSPHQATLSAKHFMRGDPFNPADPAALGFSATMARTSASSSGAGASSSGGGGAWAATAAARGRSYSGARAAYGDYASYPEGRPIFLPEAERFGNPPDLPSLLLQQRVIYISMPVRARE